MYLIPFLILGLLKPKVKCVNKFRARLGRVYAIKTTTFSHHKIDYALYGLIPSLQNVQHKTPINMILNDTITHK